MSIELIPNHLSKHGGGRTPVLVMQTRSKLLYEPTYCHECPYQITLPGDATKELVQNLF